MWRAIDKRSGKTLFLEMFAWADGDASAKAHQEPAAQAVWAKLNDAVEDMILTEVEEITKPPAAPKRVVKVRVIKTRRAAQKRKVVKSCRAAPKRKAIRAKGRKRTAKRR